MTLREPRAKRRLDQAWVCVSSKLSLIQSNAVVESAPVAHSAIVNGALTTRLPLFINAFLLSSGNFCVISRCSRAFLRDSFGICLYLDPPAYLACFLIHQRYTLNLFNARWSVHHGCTWGNLLIQLHAQFLHSLLALNDRQRRRQQPRLRRVLCLWWI